MSSKPLSKIMQAVDVVKRVMCAGNFGIYEGAIYKKIPEASFTYVYCSTVKTYLLSIVASVEIADVVVPFMAQLTKLLSEPACRLVKPIKMDFNYIEVNNGYCFNIDQKQFEQPENLDGSPRAFIRYDCCKTPYPKLFFEGLSTNICNFLNRII